MWSFLNSFLNRFLDRPRLTVDANITGQSDRPPYRFDGRVLLINIVNPTGVDIPIDKITISVDGIPWLLNPQLDSEECEQPPTTIPARSRCQFWIDAIDVAETFIQEEWSGQSYFDVVVHLSTGKSNRSKPVSIDLDLFGKYLAHRQRRKDKEIRDTFRRALENQDDNDEDST